MAHYSSFRNSDFAKDIFYRKERFRGRLELARKAGYSTYINEVRKVNNSKEARKWQGDIWLQDMFRDNWGAFLEENDKPENPIRKSIKKNVAKMITCQDPDGGFFYYECPECHDFCIVTHTCKSRFCPRCGKKYRDKISASVSEKMLDIPHRQLVFTVPPALRPMMREHRTLLGELFAGVNEAMEFIIQDKAPNKYKKEGRRLGFVCFLHTYGRQLNWHPHVHILYAERWMNKEGKMGKLDFIPFNKIKKSFMYIMCRRIRWFYLRKYGKGKEYFACCQLIKEVIAHHPNGFYFYGPKRDEETTILSVKAMAGYIARYASHPAISERRIERYNKLDGLVTWFYDPHEDDGKDQDDPTLLGRQHITEPCDEFIKRLIIHIPDSGFQQIRYYGFYSNAWKAKSKGIGLLFPSSEIITMKKKNRWEDGIVEAFGYNPLTCSCGKRMKYVIEKSNLEGFT